MHEARGSMFACLPCRLVFLSARLPIDWTLTAAAYMLLCLSACLASVSVHMDPQAICGAHQRRCILSSTCHARLTKQVAAVVASQQVAVPVAANALPAACSSPPSVCTLVGVHITLLQPQP
jgi:hypothetical protein